QIHTIPTSFNPAIEDHREDLLVANTGLAKDTASIHWLNPEVLQVLSKRHSTIVITLQNQTQTGRWTRESVWFDGRKRRTEEATEAEKRCYNCCDTGHTTYSCPKPALCPYCGDTHKAHLCPKKGATTSKCTSCARRKLECNKSIEHKSWMASNLNCTHHSRLSAPPGFTAKKIASHRGMLCHIAGQDAMQ
ncbi:hypothetical protein CROQUDRAFT_35281, partial [Cronartium quercuum f. sp. fusiforme G11]